MSVLSFWSQKSYPFTGPSSDMFKIVHYVTHTVSRRAVDIRLKCLLVISPNTISRDQDAALLRQFFVNNDRNLTS